MNDEPGSPELPQRLPTRELLLAQALEGCITAERQNPASGQALIVQQPAWARADLYWMMGLAGSLHAAAADARMSPEFRLAARARLMTRIGGEAAHEAVALIGPRLSAVPSRTGHQPMLRHKSAWLWRGSASLVAAVFGVAATLTASASALPGEPLYHVKQAQEALNVRLAADDQARARALLGQADARLDETARLLQQGRTEAANETTQRYGQVVERATTTYVVTIDDTPEQAPGTVDLETRLTQQQEQLQTILQTAPEPARAELREALVTTERGRALVADPRPVEQALGRSTNARSVVAAAVPTMAAEDLPTLVPTRRPAVVPVPLAPQAVVAQANEQPAVVAQQAATDRDEEGAARGPDTTQNNGARTQNASQNNGGRAQDRVPNRGSPAQQPARAAVSTRDQHPDEATSPTVLAPDDGDADAGLSVVGRGGTTPTGRSLPPQGQVNSAREHTDDGTQPLDARQAVGPILGSDARAGSDDRSATDGTATGEAAPGTTAPSQLAATADKPNGGTVGRDAGDARSVPQAPPAAKVQPTPGATPGRRTGGDNTGTDTSRPTPAHTSPSDPRSGDGGHGGE